MKIYDVTYITFDRHCKIDDGSLQIEDGGNKSIMSIKAMVDVHLKQIDDRVVSTQVVIEENYIHQQLKQIVTGICK